MNSNYTVRDLPLSGTGSKYRQLQEDSLPVLEFGNLNRMKSDIYMRADANVAQIEAIRCGSASTFASDSPGRVINFVLRTETEEGGQVIASTVIDFDEKRLDFDHPMLVRDNNRTNFQLRDGYHAVVKSGGLGSPAYFIACAP